jgi:hypothetical protein
MWSEYGWDDNLDAPAGQAGDGGLAILPALDRQPDISHRATLRASGEGETGKTKSI